MKVIFLKSIPSVGKKFDVKDVADGYALNYLFPNSAAEMATEVSLMRLEKMKAANAASLKVQEDLLAKNLEAVSAASIEIEKAANEKGHLFDSIHKDVLVAELKAQARVDVPADFIDLPKAIKEVGEHDITVNAGGKKATFKVIVKAA